MKHRDLLTAIETYLNKKAFRVEGNVLKDSKGNKIIDGNLNKGVKVNFTSINRY